MEQKGRKEFSEKPAMKRGRDGQVGALEKKEEVMCELFLLLGTVFYSIIFLPAWPA